jgi:hypothetical protein
MPKRVYVRTVSQRKVLSDAHRGVKLSVAHADAISMGHRGVPRTDEERKNPKKASDKRYTEKLKKNLCEMYARDGNRCSNPDCRWQNKDGSFGCNYIRILQLDHLRGGGTKERKRYGRGYFAEP